MTKVTMVLGIIVVATVLLAPFVTHGWIVTTTNHHNHRRAVVRLWSSTSVAATAPTNNAKNNNIVLEPSGSGSGNADDEETESHFDSLKVGSARVHRYSRSADPDSETEYVMWYHGRNDEQDAAHDSSLPPLSTGRIGRAVSRNGLHWEKDRVGSASEDVPGVAVGTNTDAWWAFDTAHVGLGNVLLPMSTPAVMTDGGVYLMYYMGGSAEETAVTDYLNVPDNNDSDSADKSAAAAPPESIRNAKIRGMNMKIGVAVSQDGVTWGRVEGDHPSGACVAPYNAADPNSHAPPDRQEELYCAWPEVTVDPNPKDDEYPFLMLYSTMTKKEKQKCIARAVSKDGFRWIKKGICLRPSPSKSGDDDDDDDCYNDDHEGCARCCLLRPLAYDESTGSWTESSKQQDGQRLKMYYEGVSSRDGKHRVMMADSDDNGATWTKRGLALDVGTSSNDEIGAEDAWDCGGVGAPHVVRMDDGSLRMYYTGQDSAGRTAIGVAKLQRGHNEWSREQATFSFASSTTTTTTTTEE